MSRRRLRVFEQYQYGPKSVLQPGDLFRATCGPVYVTDSGKVIPLRQRGIFVFKRYCVQGAARWIEAYHKDGGGIAILWVGKSGPSPVTPNLRRRPYRIARVHPGPPHRRQR